MTIAGKKQFLWVYPPPAIVALLLPTKVSSSHRILLEVPRWCLLYALEHSTLNYHGTSFCLFPCCPALIPFGDVFFKASGVHETPHRWPLMAAATALMWETSSTDAQGQSLLIVPQISVFSSSWIYSYITLLSHPSNCCCHITDF